MLIFQGFETLKIFLIISYVNTWFKNPARIWIYISCQSLSVMTKIVLGEFLSIELTQELEEGLGPWQPTEIRIKILKNIKGENFGSHRHLGEIFRVTSWEFLFEFWRFIFSQSICPIYSESTIFFITRTRVWFTLTWTDSRAGRFGSPNPETSILNGRRSTWNFILRNFMKIVLNFFSCFILFNFIYFN